MTEPNPPPPCGWGDEPKPDAPGPLLARSAEAEPADLPAASGAGMDVAAAPLQSGPERSRRAGNAPGQPELRLCAHCEAAMPLRPGETAAQYAYRLYCDRRCSVAAGTLRQQGRSAAAKDAKEAKRSIGRHAEQDAIARFIAERGVTRLPPAFAAPSLQAALPPEDAARRIVLLTADPDRSRRDGETKAMWYARIGVTGATPVPARNA